MSTDLLSSLWSAVLAMNPRHRRFLEGALHDVTTDELDTLRAYLMAVSDGDVQELAVAYNTIVRDIQREQLWFSRHGRYRCSTFAEVADLVYFDADYMRRYMLGLAISNVVWPNHAAIRRHFAQQLPRGVPGTYLEVGPGHGFGLVEAARLGAFTKHVAVDLSAASLAIAQRGMATLAPEAEVTWAEADFLEADVAKGVHAMVMGEVLEHVEAPERFLARAHELLVPGGWLYVTTAINAPAIDHIYLYETPEQVVEQVEAAGFDVTDTLALPHVGATLAQCRERRLPVNIAVVARRRT